VIRHLARCVGVSPEAYRHYDLDERLARYHKERIRQWTGFRQGNTMDAEAITAWVGAHSRVDETTIPVLIDRLTARYKQLQIELPTPGRLERLAHSAAQTVEEQFFARLTDALAPDTRHMIDAMLTDMSTPGSLSALKIDTGRRSLNSLEGDVEKLHQLQRLTLPQDLLVPLSTRYLRRMKLRVTAESLSATRRHPDPIRYGLVTLFCYARTQEITDRLVELLLHIVRKMGVNAEKRVDEELLADFKRVTGKTGILFQMAEASLDHPKGQVDEVIYPVVGEQTLETSSKSIAPRAAPIGKKSTRSCGARIATITGGWCRSCSPSSRFTPITSSTNRSCKPSIWCRNTPRVSGSSMERRRWCPWMVLCLKSGRMRC
jgi:hypothetical protein